MATHKVPQDVEADDKLIGPFSFRQIVYLLISAGAGFLAFELGKLALPLAIIPAPVCIFFLVIALPLRKDQPTEIYLAAVVKYFFKPHQRMWIADGEAPLVEISAPVTEKPAIKDLDDAEVSRRLSFLTNITDTQGWSTRGYSVPVNNTNLNDDYASDAVNAPDIMEGGALNDAIGQKLAQSDEKVRSNAIKEMYAAAAQSADDVLPDLQSSVVAPQHKSIQPIANNPTITTEAMPQPSPAPQAVQPAAPAPAQHLEPKQPPASAPVDEANSANTQQSVPEPAIMENDEPVIDVKLH